MGWPRASPCLGEPAHLPLPWGIVLRALAALLPPPGALASANGSVALGRLCVRRPLLGRSLLRGLVFRAFSWSALLVTLTPESCGEKRRTWAMFFLLIPPRTRETRLGSPLWGTLVGSLWKQQSSRFLTQEEAEAGPVEAYFLKFNGGGTAEPAQTGPIFF